MEECLHVGAFSDREERNVELSDETQDVKAKANPRANGAKHSSKWQVVGGAASTIPCLAESNVRKANRSPGEEVRKTGEGEQPCENVAPLRSSINVGEASKKERDDENDIWTALLVDSGSDCWTHSLGAKCLDGTGGCKCTGVCDGDDTQRDNSVEDGREDLDTGESERQNEWGVAGLTSRCIGKGLVVGWNNQSEEEERDDVEQGDTPEDLLGSFRDGLARVVSFGGSKSNEFSSTKSE